MNFAQQESESGEVPQVPNRDATQAHTMQAYEKRERINLPSKHQKNNTFLFTVPKVCAIFNLYSSSSLANDPRLRPEQKQKIEAKEIQVTTQRLKLQYDQATKERLEQLNELAAEKERVLEKERKALQEEWCTLEEERHMMQEKTREIMQSYQLISEGKTRVEQMMQETQAEKTRLAEEAERLRIEDMAQLQICYLAHEQWLQAEKQRLETSRQQHDIENMIAAQPKEPVSERNAQNVEAQQSTCVTPQICKTRHILVPPTADTRVSSESELEVEPLLYSSIKAPRKRPQKKNTMDMACHEHMQNTFKVLFPYAKHEANFMWAPSAAPEDINAFKVGNHTGPSVGDLKIDMQSSCVKWNVGVAQLIFEKIVELSKNHPEQTRNYYLNIIPKKIKRLRSNWRRSKPWYLGGGVEETKNDITERNQKQKEQRDICARWNARCNTLWKQRNRTCERIVVMGDSVEDVDTWKFVCHILTTLGLEGMSSEESEVDTETSRTMYHIHVLAWRRDVTKFMDFIDAHHEKAIANAGNKGRMDRKRDGKFTSERRPAYGLPRSFYDGAWLNTRNAE